jgi:hypothetical protein
MLWGLLFQIFSDSIPFFERDGGKKIKQLNDKKILILLSI